MATPASPDEYSGWRTSSRSKDSAECVEVAACTHPGAGVGIRDSKQPPLPHGPGPILALTPVTWRQFLRQVRTGQHDLP